MNALGLCMTRDMSPVHVIALKHSELQKLASSLMAQQLLFVELKLTMMHVASSFHEAKTNHISWYNLPVITD